MKEAVNEEINMKKSNGSIRTYVFSRDHHKIYFNYICMYVCIYVYIYIHTKRVYIHLPCSSKFW